ncbi:MAG: pyridoxine 5'-phosphate synthase [Verrucomicrobiales bacterium]|nr:pyridoxine 5'-phosphate synthase [Verrucomicrobiales bacterium]
MQGDVLELGVNVDHVATLRQARYAGQPDSFFAEPCVVQAALDAERGGASGITAHLREDRRHMQDRDVVELSESISTRLNFELGNSADIVSLALSLAPYSACIVPENRQEITTEGGLDVCSNIGELTPVIRKFQDVGVKVSLFIDPSIQQVEAAARCGVEMIELHTGNYANQPPGDARDAELKRLRSCAVLAHQSGLQVNAGHGITIDNLPGLFDVPHLKELNVGHHLVSRALHAGFYSAVKEMVDLMSEYRG